MPVWMSPIGRRMSAFDLSGASRPRLCWLGSSMLTLIRSASSPSRAISRSSAPGIALAWM